MAVDFVTKKCDQCAGRLEYIKSKKIWKCKYCGAEVEKQEQYDGLFTIKNVVRQVLLDISYRRIDNARNNLVECEKIDSRYIGTLIARIAFRMFLLSSPDKQSYSSGSSLTAQLKRDYDMLLEENRDLSDEEEILYAFFDNSDIYATLFLVYDSLNDVKRRDYVLSVITVSDIYSVETNKNLLGYAIRNRQFDLLDKIILNKVNIDLRFTLTELLMRCPEYQSKTKNIQILFKLNAFSEQDKNVTEHYLANSVDSVELKCDVIAAASDCGIYPDIQTVMDYVISKASTELIEKTLPLICFRDLTDEEMARILDFSVSSGNYETTSTVFAYLKNSGQYVEISQSQVNSLLSRNDLQGDDKAAILTKIFEYNVGDKTKNAIISNYLCTNNSEPEERMVVIDELFKNVDTISTSTINNYVLNINTDSDKKPEVIKKIFELNIKTSFFHDLLSKYVKSVVDSSPVKGHTISILIENGIQIDSVALTEYACSSHEDNDLKVEHIRMMIGSGAQVRSDAAKIYLENVSPNNFSPLLFKEICSNYSIFDEASIQKHVLYCRYNDKNKLKDLEVISAQCSADISSIDSEVIHLKNKVRCNLIQAYVLIAPDNAFTADSLVRFMLTKRLKLNDSLTVNGDKKVKFKKYISSKESHLSDVTRQLCKSNKII